jgi:hypothetical protein
MLNVVWGQDLDPSTPINIMNINELGSRKHCEVAKLPKPAPDCAVGQGPSYDLGWAPPIHQDLSESSRPKLQPKERVELATADSWWQWCDWNRLP